MSIVIDGSYGEGGGQIVRMAVVLSILTGHELKVFNIRKGRKKPGLKTQHLHVFKAIKEITDSKVTGDKLGSQSVTFTPGKIHSGQIDIDFKTAGSITLFLQTLLPVMLFAENPTFMRIIGGTDVPMSMTWDYFENVVLPYYRTLSNGIKTRCLSRGYYPAGGGVVEIHVKPRFSLSKYSGLNGLLRDIRKTCYPLRILRFEPKKITAVVTSSKRLASRKVRERLIHGLLKGFNQIGQRPEIKGRYEMSISPGCSVTVYAESDSIRAGIDKLCAKGVPAESIGEEAATKFLKFLNSKDAVDSNLQDNLLLLLALLGGRIKTGTLTSHTKTGIWLIERFLGSVFKYDGEILEVDPNKEIG